MREIPLFGKYGEGRVTLIDDEDYALAGGFRWHVSQGGYVVYSFSSTEKVYMHRLILSDVPEADHVGGNLLDNQRKNLRPATHNQNTQNRRAWSSKLSHYLGVFWRKDKRKWTAAIKGRHSGYFQIEEDAALAYNDAALEEYGEFARLNRLTPEGRE